MHGLSSIGNIKLAIDDIIIWIVVAVAVSIIGIIIIVVVVAIIIIINRKGMIAQGKRSYLRSYQCLVHHLHHMT